MYIDNIAEYIGKIVTVISNAATVESSGELKKSAEAGMFNTLVETVNLDPDLTPMTNRKNWEDTLRYGEDKWCEDNFSEIPEAKHSRGKRAGQWKYRTLLPNPYTSAKSLIGKAIERGVDPRGKGKSAIQNESNAAEDAADSSLDVGAKFVKLTDKLRKAYDEITDPAVKDACDEYLRKVFP